MTDALHKCASVAEDELEAAYWRFDARRKGYSEWELAPMSERDAFKAELRATLKRQLAERDALLDRCVPYLHGDITARGESHGIRALLAAIQSRGGVGT